ncbi:MAG: AtpZ/AtpI family protein [Bacteroidales bacterium]|nr:AtpZ/AtpI family protein [Bacteroidales bacterium]
MNQQKKTQHRKKRKTENETDDSLKGYARYSGMALQMIVIITAMTYAGVWLDSRREGDTPVFTIIMSLLGIFVALYTSLKDFINKK